MNSRTSAPATPQHERLCRMGVVAFFVTYYAYFIGAAVVAAANSGG